MVHDWLFGCCMWWLYGELLRFVGFVLFRFESFG